MNRILKTLEEEGFIHRASFATKRYFIEERSLQKTLKKSGYLALYNVGIRYCFMLVLKYGYDIRENMVHIAFKNILKVVLRVDHRLSSEIVKTRHAIKYNSGVADPTTTSCLKKIIDELSSLCMIEGQNSEFEKLGIAQIEIVKK